MLEDAHATIASINILPHDKRLQLFLLFLNQYLFLFGLRPIQNQPLIALSAMSPDLLL